MTGQGGGWLGAVVLAGLITAYLYLGLSAVVRLTNRRTRRSR